LWTLILSPILWMHNEYNRAMTRLGPSHRERKCADTIDTAVFLGWPFQMLKYQYIFQIRYTEAVLPNITKMLIAVSENNFTVSFIIIFHTFIPCSHRNWNLLRTHLRNWTERVVHLNGKRPLDLGATGPPPPAKVKACCHFSQQLNA